MSSISQLLTENNLHLEILSTAGKLAEKDNITAFVVGGFVRDGKHQLPRVDNRQHFFDHPLYPAIARHCEHEAQRPRDLQDGKCGQEVVGRTTRVCRNRHKYPAH